MEIYSNDEKIKELISKNNLVKEFRMSSNTTLLYAAYDSPWKLSQDYTDFKNMRVSLQIISDQKSIELFNKTNKERYEIMRHYFENKGRMHNVKYSPASKYKPANDDEIEHINYMLDNLDIDIVEENSDILNIKDICTPLPMYTIKESDEILKSYSDIYTESNMNNIYLVYGFRKEYRKLLKNKPNSFLEKFAINYKSIIQKLQESNDAVTQIQLGWNPNVKPTDDNLELSSMNTKLKIINYRKYKSITESMTNEFPVEFNKDGDLLISKGKNIDFEGEFSRTHLSLKLYEKTNNIVGMKYSICKLWYMNILLEEKLHSKKISQQDRRDINKVRSKVLGDINKYTKIVLKKDPNFNILETYQNSPFNNEKIRVNNSTLGYLYSWIRRLCSF